MRNSRCKFLRVLSVVFMLNVLLPVGYGQFVPASDSISAEVPDWENPEVIGRNKEPGHCTLVPYPDT
ncbi:MAG: hypothetical protein ACYSYV_11220, partial [Planctomycetota bacterium]